MANLNDVKDLEEVFVYHKPFGTQTDRYIELRSVAKTLAASVLMHCPPSRERSLAMTALQEAVMWANAAIAINEKPVSPAEHEDLRGKTDASVLGNEDPGPLEFCPRCSFRIRASGDAQFCPDGSFRIHAAGESCQPDLPDGQVRTEK